MGDCDLANSTRRSIDSSVANVKRALRGIPPKQPGEEPATERQLGYLRSFGFFSEKSIQGLGKWQASYLIDEANVIKAEGETSEDSYYPSRKRKRGCASSLLLLVAGFVVLVVLLKLFDSASKDSSTATNEVKSTSIAPSTSKERTRPTQKNSPPPPGSSSVVPSTANGIESIDTTTGIVQNLTSTPLPVTIETVEGISLLNKTGKETAIPPGVLLTIKERKASGTLALDIDGEFYVGNENRLFGKVKIAETSLGRVHNDPEH